MDEWRLHTENPGRMIEELMQENSMLKEMMWKVSGDLDNIRAVIKPFLDEAHNPFRKHSLRVPRDNSIVPIREEEIPPEFRVIMPQNLGSTPVSQQSHFNRFNLDTGRKQIDQRDRSEPNPTEQNISRFSTQQTYPGASTKITYHGDCTQQTYPGVSTKIRYPGDSTPQIYPELSTQHTIARVSAQQTYLRDSTQQTSHGPYVTMSSAFNELMHLNIKPEPEPAVGLDRKPDIYSNEYSTMIHVPLFDHDAEEESSFAGSTVNIQNHSLLRSLSPQPCLSPSPLQDINARQPDPVSFQLSENQNVNNTDQLRLAVEVRLKKLPNKSKNASQCNQCSFSSSFNGGLMRHTTMMHGPRSLTKSKLSKTSVRKHERNEPGDKSENVKTSSKVAEKIRQVVQCNQCEYLTYTPARLLKHKYLKHADKKFKCNECSFSSRKNTWLLQHKRKEHCITYNCDKCAFSTLRKIKYNKHMRSHEAEGSSITEVGNVHKSTKCRKLECKKYYCKQCDYFTTDKKDLRMHTLYSHMIEGRKTEPAKLNPLISRPSKKSADLAVGEILVHKEFDHSTSSSNGLQNVPKQFCDDNDLSSTTETGLKTHKAKMHLNLCTDDTLPAKSQKKTKIYHCDYCDFVSRFEGGLKRHKTRKHTAPSSTSNKNKLTDDTLPAKSQKKTKIYYCDYCDAVFKFEGGLKRHKTRIHTAPSSTSNKNKLINNKIVKHSVESSQDNLDKECSNTESQDLPSEVRKRVMKDCDMCDFSADRKSILRKHMKEMHFQCDQCKKFAATKFGLVVHKRKKHGRVVKPVATDYLQVENRTQQNSVKSEEVENQVIPGDHTEEKDLFSKVNIENPFYNPE